MASGNALGFAETELDALALVRELIAAADPSPAADLLLMYEDARGEHHSIAAGEELVQRALAPRAADMLEHILQLVAEQRAQQQPNLDAIEQAVRSGLAEIGPRSRHVG